MTIRTMSSNEAKQNWGQVMAVANEPDTTIIIESHGKPRVAVISYDELTAYRAFRTEQLRQEGLRVLREIEAAYDGRNDDLTDEQINDLAARSGREYWQEFAASEVIAFERDDR